MLVVHFKNGISLSREEYLIGDVGLGGLKHSEVLFIEADGEELDFIRNNFESIPLAHSDKIRWVGEMATFIISNIASLKAYREARNKKRNVDREEREKIRGAV